MLDHKHENMTEIHTLMAAPLTVTTLQKSEQKGFEYPVSGDVLALKTRHGEHTAQVVGQRAVERIEHNV